MVHGKIHSDYTVLYVSDVLKLPTLNIWESIIADNKT